MKTETPKLRENLTQYPSITVADVEREATLLVAKHPETVYEPPVAALSESTCYYTRGAGGEAEGCLVGQALVNAGVSVSDLASIDKTSEINVLSAHSVIQMLGIKGDASFLNDLQWSQDDGLEWMEAHRHAAQWTAEFL